MRKIKSERIYFEKYREANLNITCLNKYLTELEKELIYHKYESIEAVEAWYDKDAKQTYGAYCIIILKNGVEKQISTLDDYNE